VEASAVINKKRNQLHLYLFPRSQTIGEKNVVPMFMQNRLPTSDGGHPSHLKQFSCVVDHFLLHAAFTEPSKYTQFNPTLIFDSENWLRICKMQ